jgi:preprotein translocase subunit Sss1
VHEAPEADERRQEPAWLVRAAILLVLVGLVGYLARELSYAL